MKWFFVLMIFGKAGGIDHMDISVHDTEAECVHVLETTIPAVRLNDAAQLAFSSLCVRRGMLETFLDNTPYKIEQVWKGGGKDS